MRARVGALISGNGSTLQAIVDCRDLIDVQLVISSDEKAYGLIRARRAGVPILFLPSELRGKENKSRAEDWIISEFEKHNIQKVFLCGYMKIVSLGFIKKFEGQIFNIHPSLLPKYRGLNSFDEALKNGDETAGVTIHHVSGDLDGGEIILQREFEIPSHRHEKESHLWLHIQEQRLLRESLRKSGSKT